MKRQEILDLLLNIGVFPTEIEEDMWALTTDELQTIAEELYDNMDVLWDTRDSSPFDRWYRDDG